MSEKIHVQAGGRSTELVRLPSLQTKDALPPEAVQVARDAISRGRIVEIPSPQGQVVGVVMTVVGLCAGLFGMVALTENVPVGIAILVIGVVLVFAGLKGDQAASPTRLQGRRVAGKGRASTELWRQALEEVDNGSRPEDELPAIHQALIEVADAEDAVNRLVARSKYKLDQSRADVARSELATCVNQARALMGLAALESGTETQPHLSNRWAESADLATPEPANPDDLR